MKQELGYRIRKLRESRDYTQENMAAELGITAGAYAKIERGETDASFTRLVSIAEILGIPIGKLLSDQKTPSKFEEAENSYGLASQSDLDTLSQLVRQILRRLDAMETDMAVIKKGKSKKQGK